MKLTKLFTLLSLSSLLVVLMIGNAATQSGGDKDKKSKPKIGLELYSVRDDCAKDLPGVLKAVAKMGYEGVFQIASLHPHYQFADALPDAITNCTNRSPYPTLHLLREDSIDRAVKAFPHAEAIFETNMRTMERLGPVGWAALDVGASTGRGKLPP